MKKPQIRREYYIYREIQLKYIRLTLLLMVLACIVMGYTIYQTSVGLLAKKLSLLCPTENIREIYGFLNSTLILRLLLLIPLAVVVTMYLSHRIAGPVFRIEKELSEISQGDFTRRIVLRENDDLQKLASELNKVISQIEDILFMLKMDVSELQVSLRDAMQAGKDKDLNLPLEKCMEVLGKISQDLARLKTRD